MYEMPRAVASLKTYITLFAIILFASVALAQTRECLNYYFKQDSLVNDFGNSSECERERSRREEIFGRLINDARVKRNAAFKAQLDAQHSSFDFTPEIGLDQEALRARQAERKNRETAQKLALATATAEVEHEDEFLAKEQNLQQSLTPCKCYVNPSSTVSNSKVPEISHPIAHQSSLKQHPDSPTRSTEPAEDSEQRQSVKQGKLIDNSSSLSKNASTAGEASSLPVKTARAGRDDDVSTHTSSSAMEEASHQALAMMKDPFTSNRGGHSREETTRPKASSDVEELSDPFTSSHESEQPNTSFKISKAVSEDFTKSVGKTLDRDLMEIERRAANNTLSASQVARATQELKDQKQVLSGFSYMMKALDVIGSAADIYKADTEVKRQEAEGKLAVKVTEDVGKFGISKIAPKLFGEAVAAALGGPITFTAAIASETLSSEKIARDPTDVIRDTSGHSSLADKQRALFEEWHWYQNNKASWGEAQKRELIQNTDTVYREYLSQEKARKTP